jgi:hypothetical protein
MTDLYHAIYQNEIFVKSRCIWHENTLMDFFRNQLISLDYIAVDDSNKVWRRGDRTVVICLVDDFTTCNTNHDLKLPYLFDRNTVVITDTWCGAPTQYQLHTLPGSFFGIYAHQPNRQRWQPQRRFNFAVNRLDQKRMLMFLELQMRTDECYCSESTQFPYDVDYVNFNCWSWDGDNSTSAGLRDNFQRHYHMLESQYHEVYEHTYNMLIDIVPYRNHDLSQSLVHHSAWMNIVMETYSSDNTVALSEKIFQALCLPVPWQLYSGRHSVARLNSLGFDTLSDVVTHKYDVMIENRTAAYGDKMVDFLFEAVENSQQFQQQDITQRCTQAAEHNIALLESMRRQWPADFAAWWPGVLVKLQ